MQIMGTNSSRATIDANTANVAIDLKELHDIKPTIRTITIKCEQINPSLLAYTKAYPSITSAYNIILKNKYSACGYVEEIRHPTNVVYSTPAAYTIRR